MRLRSRPGPKALRSRALRRWIRGEPVWLPREQIEALIPPLPDDLTEADTAFLTTAAGEIGRRAGRMAAKETKRARRRAARRP